MPESKLASQTATAAGVTLAFTAANASGHSVDVGDLLYVKNGSGSSINVTIVTPGTAHGNDIADRVVAVPAGSEKLIGGLSDGYTSALDGFMHITFSAVTTVTVAAIKVV